MKKPYKFTIFCNKTGKILSETNMPPSPYQLHTWEDTEEPNVKVLTQTKTCWVDTRYLAKLRLWNYITYTKNGLKIPRYSPYAGTEIGKSLPILNF